MDQRLPIDAITKETIDLTYKVQVVDKFRPRENRDQSVQFQTIHPQDEKEQQVVIVLYGDDIPKYERVEDNEQILVSYTLRSSSASPSSVNLAPIEDEVFPISTTKVVILGTDFPCGRENITS
ncbi:hypothetical protein T459_23422 [Capsicum annuum]|uniref:Uncharacterized protein n=1 Tax=Capsicum annuum TaxID=4072 RepID=A0A2G2YS99_CAPAN|nr:hypothetical protein T459_23422 [Capsicum annuum]